MTTSSLIPFAIALLSAFIAYQSQEEIVKAFFVIVMAMSLLVSFCLGIQICADSDSISELSGNALVLRSPFP
ncbi:MAG: hypothetical protein J0L70_24125 [Leptolyngbya sp. UWPOB_LEPTO1]|uniref:hypothetical protein n=1 Tax=Leptolyngbya sp. UWPOB_LEPTO1 TaxID=2815653 RepID=UPI001AD394F0|nr:hypothetical protein [Leptolyngbya sp. UWPOB_LEPTO1]MBN8563629.1 hypothetical protein [Leptolyngbya sp. UWPOB_LEPTO1]